MKQNVKIILASGSPRRRELLQQVGLEFTVLVTDADESTDITDPAELVEVLSRRKAEYLWQKERKNGPEVRS